MTKGKYTITFDFQLDQSAIRVPLVADIEVHHSEIYYVVKNIRTGREPQRVILPDFEIKKLAGDWVHCDSEKETALSVAVGKTIDDENARQSIGE